MDWINLINTVAFPIVACIALAVFVYKQTENNRKDINAMQDKYDKQMAEFTVALNNNTLAIQKLCDKLDIKEGD